MFARGFNVWLFSAKRSFARGGVPTGVLLSTPEHARMRAYQLRYIPKCLSVKGNGELVCQICPQLFFAYIL